MEEFFVCPLCKKSFLNGNQLEAHVIVEHNNIEHDQVGIDCGKGVELDKRKLIKKEIKLEIDEEKLIKKEIKLEADENYGVKSYGPNKNWAIDKKAINKEIKLEVDKKVIKKEIKLEVDEKVIKKEIKLEVDEDYGVKSYDPNKNPKKFRAHPITITSDLISKQCGKVSHSSSGLASHMKTHSLVRKRSKGTNSDDEVKKGALSLVMLSENRKDLYLDEDKLVIPNVYVDGVKKEGNGESGAGQSSTGIVNTNLRSNVQEVRDKGNRKANDNQSSTVLSGPKTYKCQTCFKEFSSFQGLGGHMKIHKQTP